MVMQATTRLLAESQMIQGQTFCFGVGVVDQKQYNYHPDTMVNSHILLAGKSQSGKTRTAKKLIEFLGQEIGGYRKTVFVIDYSGDMGVEGENYIPILARKSPYGISLFEFSKDHESGGVNVARDNIVRMINRYFMKNGMGTVQRAVLERLITDSYALSGIVEQDERTWENRLPTVEDMLELMGDIREAVESGIDYGVVLSIRDEQEKVKRINLKIKESKDDEVIIGAQKEREVLKQDILKKVTKYINWKIDGEEPYDEVDISSLKLRSRGIDVGFYAEKNAYNALKDLRIHIEKLVESKAFSADRPPVINGVNRFDLSTLSVPLQKMFTDILIARTFSRVRARGKYAHYAGRIPGFKIDTAIVIDEAKLIIPSERKDKESIDEPINRGLAEGLKFGLAFVMASQRLDHFSQEILSNTHTKLIFELGANDFGSAKNLLGIKESDMGFVKKFGVGLLFSGSRAAAPVAMPWAQL